MQNKIKGDTAATENISEGAEISEVPAKKKKFTMVRAALVCLIVFTLICGIIYPIIVTIVGQTVFPYEANGSQIVVTMPDGTQKIYGSELIGQNYESAEYMFGRVNTGAPSNLSPESDAFKQLVQERIAERKEKLAAVGYTDESAIPDELLTSSGSGVDPHISPATAYFQINAIIAGRKAAGWKLLTNADGNVQPIQLKDGETAENYPLKEGESLSDYTEDFIRGIIDQYTEGRFLWIFGQERVTVLLVNLALDGLI